MKIAFNVEQMPILATAQIRMKAISICFIFVSSALVNLLFLLKIRTKRETFVIVIAIMIVFKKKYTEGKRTHVLLVGSRIVEKLAMKKSRWQINCIIDNLNADDRTSGVCLFKINIIKMITLITMPNVEVNKIIIPA